MSTKNACIKKKAKRQFTDIIFFDLLSKDWKQYVAYWQKWKISWHNIMYICDFEVDISITHVLILTQELCSEF